MLMLYRRHSADCPRREFAWNEKDKNKCRCPVWVYGNTGAKRIPRTSLKTRIWNKAEAAIERWMENPQEHERVAAQKIRIGDAIERFITKGLVELDRAPATITSYKGTLYPLWDFAEGCKDPKTGHRPKAFYMGELDLTFLGDFETSRIHRLKAKSSRWLHRKNLSNFVSFCVNHKWLDENYAKRLQRIKAPQRATEPFEEEDIYRLLDACDTIDGPYKRYLDFTRKRMRALFLTMLYTGLRIGDTIALERSRLLPDGRLILRQQKTKGMVTVKLPAHVIEAIKAMPPHPDYPKLLSPHFFWTEQNSRKTLLKSLHRSMKAIGKRVGIRVHAHRFRDTFAVTLLNQGEDIRTVQLLLGHKSLQTTERFYAAWAKPQQDRLHSAVAGLPNWGREATTGQVIPFPSKD